MAMIKKLRYSLLLHVDSETQDSGTTQTRNENKYTVTVVLTKSTLALFLLWLGVVVIQWWSTRIPLVIT